MKMTLLAAITLTASTAIAKPVYLTVSRTYGTDESPVIDLSFESKGPVELRVLKPNNLAAFIDKQADLRRGYQVPPLLDNPGQALIRGLNHLKGPAHFLFSNLRVDFRQKAAGAFKPREEQQPSPSPRMVNESEKLVGIPPGMTLVRSQWLNLDLGGSDSDFNVPGFSAWTGSGLMQERRVSLPPLEAGIYLVQLVQAQIEGQVVLVVSDLTAQVKQTDGKVLVRVAGRDQQPRKDVLIKVKTSQGSGPSGITDAQGEVLLGCSDSKLLITASLGTDTAIVDTDFYSTLAVSPDVFLYTDRPIYKPGDEVKFRGVVRQPDSFLARLFSPKHREVTVTLTSQEGKIASTTAQVDDLSSFSGTLTAPAEAQEGVLRVSAILDGHAYRSEARVQAYVKPTFYLELSPEGETVVPGQMLKAKVRTRRYDGATPKNVHYEVFLFRTLVDSPSWVDDAGKGGQGSAVTYGSGPSTSENKLSIPERLYSTVAQRMDAGELKAEDPWASAPVFDSTGEAALEIAVPNLKPGDERFPYRYSLSIRARDDQGTFANSSSSFFLSKVETLGTVRFSSPVIQHRAELSVSIRSTTLDGKPYPTAEGSVSFVLRNAKGDEKTLETRALTTDGNGIWRGPAPTQAVGTLLAKVALKDHRGGVWSGESHTLVIGDAEEAVAKVSSLTLETEGAGKIFQPGDSIQLVGLLPESWGALGKNQGPLWLTLSGTTVFDTQMISLKGLTLTHSITLEKRYGSVLYASIAYPTHTGRWEERTVSFRIVPAERTLQISLQPLQEEASPLGPQTVDIRVTDDRGRGTVAQLSVGVVDKAVYAIQNEFRPNVLEFFYPVGRNNVSNFYSMEFQGYGYGEALSRMLSALPNHPFASIKPPTRRPKDLDRDTAYWNPSVITDSEGHASVRFNLPSNQTLWTITALAADARGRFGETTAEFASRGTLNLFASVPAFLRAGDSAQGIVRLSAGTLAKETQHLHADLLASNSLGGVHLTPTFNLEAKGEQLIPINLKADPATPSDSSVLQIQISGGKDLLKDSRRISIVPAAIDDVVAVRQWGGGKLSLPIGGNTTVQSVELTLLPTTVDAALANVRELLTYPYGCLEQLVSTTVPNVAVYQVLSKLGALDKLDPESQALLAEARSRAVQGVDRILKLAVNGGGFTWFNGYTQPSMPLTLIALDGLSYAAEAGLVNPSSPELIESARWLEAQGDLPEELEATRTYVLARMQGPQQAARVRQLVEKVRAGNPYVMALAVIAADKSGVMKEPAFQDRVHTWVEQSRSQFLNFAQMLPQTAAFWNYPLRRVGLMAILGHAASYGPLDETQARKHLIEAFSDGNLSTFDRGTALIHSLWMIERDAKAMRKLAPPRITGTATPVRFTPRGTGLVSPVDIQTRSLEVGAFEGVAVLTAHVKTPADDLKALDQGMSIARHYYVLREGQRQALRPSDSVTQGEDVYVELILDSKGSNRSRSAYYVVEDSVPAGFVPLTEDKAYQGAPFALPLAPSAMKRRTLNPERVSFFFEEPTWWSDSPRSVGYVMRAQFAGRFTALPATVSDMYAVAVKGRTTADRLEIKH